MNRAGLGKAARQPDRKKLEREVERLQEALANAERDADSWEAEVDRWYDLVPPQISRADIHGAIELQMRFVAEYERLRAIVDKLPKCWRLDETGKLVQDVPVVPDADGVWKFIPELNEVRCTHDTYGGIARFVGEWNTVSHFEFLVSDCYNTREAAEAAREANDE